MCFKTQKRLPSLTSEVLDVMRFVQYHIAPVFSSEDVLIRKDNLVRRYANLPGIFGVPSHTLLFPLFLVSVIGEYLHAREKFFELHLPIKDNRGGDDDEMLTPDAFIASKVA